MTPKKTEHWISALKCTPPIAYNLLCVGGGKECWGMWPSFPSGALFADLTIRFISDKQEK